MPVTLEGVDAQIKAASTLLHTGTDLQREVAQCRVDWLLDLRNQLTRPPVAPEFAEPVLEHGTD